MGGGVEGQAGDAVERSAATQKPQKNQTVSSERKEIRM
jgi:hypothetical protein